MPLVAVAGDTSSGESDKNVPLPATIVEFLAALNQETVLSAFIASPSIGLEYMVEDEEECCEPGPLVINFPACFVSSAGHLRSYSSSELTIGD